MSFGDLAQLCSVELWNGKPVLSDSDLHVSGQISLVLGWGCNACWSTCLSFYKAPGSISSTTEKADRRRKGEGRQTGEERERGQEKEGEGEQEQEREQHSPLCCASHPLPVPESSD